ncbi:MAG: response regulator [Deltaproteobacteria bacterium]|nr:response regulator [Deltaproteobacteria bacterium]
MNRILVVDDDTAIQLLYTDEFTEEGYEVITTGNGSGIVKLIEEKRPDLVVLDRVYGKSIVGHDTVIRSADLKELKRKIKNVVESGRQFPQKTPFSDPEREVAFL